MKMKSDDDSTMQKAVWKMKEKVYESTKGMSCREYFQYINTKADKELTNPVKESNIHALSK